MVIGRTGHWTKWLLAEVAIGRYGYWPKWSLDEVVMDEMALAEMGLDEMAIAHFAYVKLSPNLRKSINLYKNLLESLNPFDKNTDYLKFLFLIVSFIYICSKYSSVHYVLFYSYCRNLFLFIPLLVLIMIIFNSINQRRFCDLTQCRILWIFHSIFPTTIVSRSKNILWMRSLILRISCSHDRLNLEGISTIGPLYSRLPVYASLPSKVGSTCERLCFHAKLQTLEMGVNIPFVTKSITSALWLHSVC